MLRRYAHQSGRPPITLNLWVHALDGKAARGGDRAHAGLSEHLYQRRPSGLKARILDNHRGSLYQRVRDASGICSRHHAVICPSGSFVSSPVCKNISVSTHPKSLLELRYPTSPEGRIAIVTNAGRDAVDAAASGAQRDAG